ncbi:thioesterase family protein [Halomonas shantousis]
MSDTQPLTPLSDVLDGLSPISEGFSATVPEDWLQGRAIYGGLSAALCLDATLKTFTTLPPLRSAQLSFIGPASSTVELRPVLVRQGKSTAFVTTDLISDGKLTVRATFCFGAARESTLSDLQISVPHVQGPEAYEPFFGQSRMAPNFAQHFNSRHAAGSMPISTADVGDVTAWLQHKDEAVRPTIVGLVALADALPPAAMCLFSEPAPVSTMTWMFDVLSEAPRTDDGWWLSRSVAEATCDGYSSQAMTVWNRHGEPVIVGRQNVAVFA